MTGCGGGCGRGAGERGLQRRARRRPGERTHPREKSPARRRARARAHGRGPRRSTLQVGRTTHDMSHRRKAARAPSAGTLACGGRRGSGREAATSAPVLWTVRVPAPAFPHLRAAGGSWSRSGAAAGRRAIGPPARWAPAPLIDARRHTLRTAAIGAMDFLCAYWKAACQREECLRHPRALQLCCGFRCASLFRWLIACPKVVHTAVDPKYRSKIF